MKAFFVGISLSFVSSLAWLSYHYPLFTTKLLFALSACLLLLQLGLKIYKSGWTANHYFIEKALLQPLFSIANLRNMQAKKAKDSIDLTLKNSLDKIKDLNKDYDSLFYTAYIIITALFIFCIIFPKYR